MGKKKKKTPQKTKKTKTEARGGFRAREAFLLALGGKQTAVL